jgi:glycerol-3-phosphate dehydrogenase
MAVSLALTAVRYGAVVVNHVGVKSLVKREGRVSGAQVTDSVTGESWNLFARVVVNATGPFADVVRRLDSPGIQPMIKVSSGVHLLLEGRFSPPGTGLLIPKTEDGRVLFILPWEGKTLVGTTDEPAEVSEHPRPMEEEIDYLVHYICKYFDLQFSRSDIRSAWSGLRPLVSNPGKADTAKLSRDHVIEESQSGLLTITGGKWTTYRKMASDTVDYAVKRFNLSQENGCRTDRIPLNGGADFHPDGGVQLAEAYGMDPSITDHLNRAYGDQARSVIGIAKEGFGETLVEGYPYLEAEVLWAARHEMACRAMDVLARRTPLALLDKAAAGSATDRTIDIMARELGWDSDRCQEELQLVQERLRSAI